MSFWSKFIFLANNIPSFDIEELESYITDHLPEIESRYRDCPEHFRRVNTYTYLRYLGPSFKALYQLVHKHPAVEAETATVDSARNQSNIAFMGQSTSTHLSYRQPAVGGAGDPSIAPGFEEHLSAVREPANYGRSEIDKYPQSPKSAVSRFSHARSGAAAATWKERVAGREFGSGKRVEDSWQNTLDCRREESNISQSFF